MTAVPATGFSVTDGEYQRFCEYFYKKTGIHFTESKRYFVDKRIENSIRSSPHETFASWFAAMRVSEGTESFQELVNQFTVNETYFLREDYQFDGLIRSVLPRVITQRGGLNQLIGPIKVLSLPCSTGEEPYSIALRMLEEWPDMDAVDVEIHGADIDSSVLEKARHGSYGERSLQRVPKGWLGKHFDRVNAGRYQVDQGIRSAITFHQMNICDTNAMRVLRDFDVIFCRNVLIYFDELSSRRAAENLYGAMRPGGYLFLGHSESMSRISPIFNPVRLAEGIVYQRPTGAR
jgi:chemotaxis protein methyltransferase CheR